METPRLCPKEGRPAGDPVQGSPTFLSHLLPQNGDHHLQEAFLDPRRSPISPIAKRAGDQQSLLGGKNSPPKCPCRGPTPTQMLTRSGNRGRGEVPGLWEERRGGDRSCGRGPGMRQARAEGAGGAASPGGSAV